MFKRPHLKYLKMSFSAEHQKFWDFDLMLNLISYRRGRPGEPCEVWECVG